MKQLNKTAYNFSVSLILIPFFIILNFLNKKESKVICKREFEIILLQTQSLSIKPFNSKRLFSFIKNTLKRFAKRLWLNLILKGQCQLQCIARSNNAWRPFYWQSNSCFGFQSVIYFNHPMVILAHFNRIVTTKHQRNVYNRYLLIPSLSR